jgi:hypothetical protein
MIDTLRRQAGLELSLQDVLLGHNVMELAERVRLTTRDVSEQRLGSDGEICVERLNDHELDTLLSDLESRIVPGACEEGSNEAKQ